MLNMHTLWVLAVAEMRSSRRLARTWVFIVVAFLFCAVWYIDHVDFSMWPNPPGSLGDDLMTARYTISTMVAGFVAIFSFGIIFLSFDIRARDIQNRISDVIDSLPASNIEIIVGRLSGILLLLLIPCMVFLALLTGYETISELAGSRFRLGIHPMSVMSFFTWSLIPNLVFYSALVACLSALLRFRLLVAVIAIGVLIGMFWIENHIPIRFQESLSPFLGSALIPSDLAPEFVTPAVLGNKCAILFVSTALTLFTASILLRTEARRTLYSVVGITASGFAVVMFLGLIAAVYDTENRRNAWVKEHRLENPTSFPDVQHLRGNIEILPGRRVSLNVTLSIHTPTANTTDSLVLSLNPGYKIQKLFVDREEVTSYNFEAGILKLPADLFPAASHEIRVQASGKPDDRFAYLDQDRDFSKRTNRGARQLGFRNSIFHSKFVALMPGVVWYPIAGTVSDRDKLELRHRDLFTTDLIVTVPKQWHVATVGAREIMENQKQRTFQFTNKVPVPELALIAANFDQRAKSIEGVGFEVLFHERHLQNLEVLTPFVDQITEWVAECIKNARAASLEYPYEMFYVVEVPSTLRIYGGGWRMDSVLQPPGMMLIRESSFPTEEFKNVVMRERARDRFSEDEQDTRIFDELKRYFGDDVQGGSPFAGFARNFVGNQVSFTERGATVLQYVLNQLSNQLITQTESLSIITLLKFDPYLPYLGGGETPDSTGYTRINATWRREQVAALPSTWSKLDQFALLDLDFDVNSNSSFRVLLTKGHALARSMIGHYGGDKVGAFLERLLTEFRGKTVTLAQFLDLAKEVGLDFDQWVLSMLEDTVLPGFLGDTATVSKLETEDFDSDQYQTTFVVHNAEPISGLVRVFWAEVNENRPVQWPSGEYKQSDPISIAGHHSKRIAIQSANLLDGIWIEPFFARNRAPFEILVAEYDEHSEQKSPPLPFAADVDWQPHDTQSIIVDDLDPNFSIVTRTTDTDEFAQVQTVSAVSDSNDDYLKGLPVRLDPSSREWRRLFEASSFGYYIRTCTQIARGDQSTAARFGANLPHDGTWKLDFYVSDQAFSWGGWGEYTRFGFESYRRRPAASNSPEEHYTLQIRNGTEDWTETFDVANANTGWNEVGSFQLGSTEVEVLLNDWAGHEEVLVYADAIRWTPVPDHNLNKETPP